ncbi:uncharacterized protein BJ171DRAFT_581767 [Polychytrium aggregatum]|uniref:uncharacterized protein n=1 Tax=Polychytrium aggregatum TaxID=110093 RepID=UPI0022FDD352|nr:uncharacterized protein BJ171DRAFT_581767 [Polychytrium aggregatum]KAI9204621.1 hypothetical protein BJ171DRAFT_581767 [Polychytrium aggregatum]
MSTTETTDPFDRAAYLGRINLTEEQIQACPPQSFELLNLLLSSHQYAIAYENLAACGHIEPQTSHVPFPGIRVSLNPNHIFKKLVLDHRGGYCFEQNILFARALAEFGFTSIQTAAARVSITTRNYVDSSQGLEPEPVPLLSKTHMILLVKVADGRTYLSDVGFSGAGQPRGPIELVPDVETFYPDSGDRYKLRKANLKSASQQSPDDWIAPKWLSDHHSVLPEDDAKESVFWFLQYSPSVGRPFYEMYLFSSDSVMTRMDYETSNWFTSTSPYSPITNGVKCSINTPTGRNSMVDSVCKIRAKGKDVVEIQIVDNAHRARVLREYFNIHV